MKSIHVELCNTLKKWRAWPFSPSLRVCIYQTEVALIRQKGGFEHKPKDELALRINANPILSMLKKTACHHPTSQRLTHQYVIVCEALGSSASFNSARFVVFCGLFHSLQNIINGEISENNPFPKLRGTSQVHDNQCWNVNFKDLTQGLILFWLWLWLRRRWNVLLAFSR